MTETMNLGSKLAGDIRAVAECLQRLADTVEGATPTQQAEAPAEPEKQSPALTLEDVRAVLAEKSRAGHTAAVHSLLEKYGAAKLSEIDPAKYAALLKDAEELDNG